MPYYRCWQVTKAQRASVKIVPGSHPVQQHPSGTVTPAPCQGSAGDAALDAHGKSVSVRVSPGPSLGSDTPLVVFSFGRWTKHCEFK